jgi:hypothetical protein
LEGLFFQAGLGLLIILSTTLSTFSILPSLSFFPFGSSIFSVFGPNLIETGRNLQYLLSIAESLDSSKNSFESSAICKITSVPFVFLV